MLKLVRSRMTYANVVATGALFVALGGGAYALSGVPDRGGVYHGCVSNKAGVLRVVKSGRSCQKPSGRGRRRNPGEFAVSWSQQGPRGLQGLRGLQGVQGVQGGKGDTGPQGPGATAFSTTLPADNTSKTLATVGGLNISGRCDAINGAFLAVDTSPLTNTLQTSGSQSNSTTISPVNTDGVSGITIGYSMNNIDIDVIARNTAVGNFMRLDLHGSANCHFWGMIIPSA